MSDSESAEGIRMEEWVDLYPKRNPAARRWEQAMGRLTMLWRPRHASSL